MRRSCPSGSINSGAPSFPFKAERFFTKWPRQFPFPVSVAFGQPLARGGGRHRDGARGIAQARRSSATAAARPARASRPRLPARPEAQHRSAPRSIDGLDHSTLSRGKLLGVATALARHLRSAAARERRIGIVLPPGKGGVVANLAVVLAGKIPVNLNFTSGREAIESRQTQAGLRTIISARAMAKKLRRIFPGPETSSISTNSCRR